MSRPLPRFTDTAIEHDPLEAMLARAEAERQTAIDAINTQSTELRQPLNPRGWPIQTKGIGGTSPGTSPHHQAAAGHMDKPHRLRRTLAA